jgi:regulator of cell morphogenesis and NO signaling
MIAIIKLEKGNWEICKKKTMMGAKKSEIVNYNLLGLDALIENISETHHTHLKELIFSLEVHLKTMFNIDNIQQPSFAPIRNFAQELKILMEEHLGMEEENLFPFVHNLTKSDKYFSLQPEYFSGHLFNKIKKEHRKILDMLRKIRRLSNNYSPDIKSSPAIKLFYAQLFNLEQDIHKHIFVEENILFPKLSDFEKKNKKDGREIKKNLELKKTKNLY